MSLITHYITCKLYAILLLYKDSLYSRLVDSILLLIDSLILILFSDVDSRNPVVSAHDPRSPVNRDRDDISSPMSSAATSIKAPLPPPSHTLSHQIQRILSLLVVSLFPAFLFPLQNPLQNHQGQNTALLLLLMLILLLTTFATSTSASFIITHSPTHISPFLSR